ncbi:MAG: AAA family ATPase [Sterolibacterium sp.]|nr:AAA family ATPase [Sterolibacterium sp.]
MKLPNPLDPYAGNILVAKLGDIPSPLTALTSLTQVPVFPGTMEGIPQHIRLHHLMAVRDLHLPPLIERQLLQTTDLMVRQGYRYRDPLSSSTWAAVSGENQRRKILLPPSFAAAVEGLSGVGKTQACLRCLHSFPTQTIHHANFPRMADGLLQTVWLSVEVPASGKSADLARALMEAWDLATGGSRFAHWLAKDKITDGMKALDEWRQVAVGHFLGVLHLDEIQNLFKLSSLKQRKNRKGSGEAPELSIVEDQLLRWLLYLTNSGQIPLLVSGTPDGIGALTRRLSTLERINTMGYHAFEPFSDPRAPEFLNTFLGQLGNFQYVRHKLAVDENLAELIIDLTGGIQRLIIALWVVAHRVAFERKEDDLRLSDFTQAASTWLAPLAPAIAALRTKDPDKMARYEDLVRRDTTFWAKFWENAAKS